MMKASDKPLVKSLVPLSKEYARLLRIRKQMRNWGIPCPYLTESIEEVANALIMRSEVHHA